MPPGFRSAPSTPARPAIATPRKSPHCKTCGRPRKGHPLRSCDLNTPPRLSTASTIEQDSPSPSTHTTATSTSLTDALDALSLSPAIEERDQADKRARRKSLVKHQHIPVDLQSLPSISTITGALLDGLTLMSPGKVAGEGEESEVEELLLEDDDDDDDEGDGDGNVKREAILQWRDANGTPRKVRLNTPDDTTPTKASLRKSKTRN
ncbi:hypothetical protein C8F01DRAFT_1160678 [Mycena amicta]|nr:hypothetical protein C8F01DRAFT_1160678 [Mycena amicta]